MATRKPAEEAEVDAGVSELSATLTDAGLEVTYSRKWSLALVQYESMELFTNIKATIPGVNGENMAQIDLTDVGTQLSDKMNELQSADLTWAKNMATNDKSLIHRIL